MNTRRIRRNGGSLLSKGLPHGVFDDALLTGVFRTSRTRLTRLIGRGGINGPG